MINFPLPSVAKIVNVAHSALAALLLYTTATVVIAQTPTVVTNPAVGVYVDGINLRARIDAASTSGVVITATRTTGSFATAGTLRVCRGQGNYCEAVIEAPYAAGATTVTFPSFTPRAIQQNFYYVQRVDATATTTGGLDPATRSGQMIVIVDSPAVGRENAAQVSVASGNACALTTTGVVKCWSAGGTPLALSGAPASVSKIALSSTTTTDFSCLLASGTVYCWGNSVGDGTSLTRTTPVAIGGITGVVTDIFVGYNRACAITGTTVWCWRDYGYEITSAQPSPPYPATLSPVVFSAVGVNVTDISMNLFGSCVLKTTGDILCWGMNRSGNLGNSNGINSTALFAANLVSGVRGKTLAGHSNYAGGHVCATTYASELWCWGSNSSSQLGRAASANPTSQPAPATLVSSNVNSAVVGGDATCAVYPGGKMSCWGDNLWGRLGVGGVAEYQPTGNRTGVVAVPIPVVLADAAVAQVSLSDSKMCVVLTNGSIKCAGKTLNVNTTSIPSSTAFLVEGFGTTLSLLSAPSIVQVTRERDIVSLKYQDNQSVTGATITAHQWACYPQSNGNLGNAAEVVTNEVLGALHIVQGTLSTRAGPWQCKVRFLTADGLSSWSSFVAVTQNFTALPTVTSAVYDGSYGTVTWRDNSTDAAGPVISKMTYCTVQWRNAPTVQVAGCEPQNSRCYANSVVSEPTNQTHVSRLAFPPATDFSSGTCRVNVETFDGTQASADVAVVQAASPAPTVVMGRVVGTQGVLTFADNRADSAGTILSAVYACTRARDGATSSSSISINEPANTQHTITVPLLGNNLLQDPDSYSCKVRVTPSVGTVSPDSAAFTIGPNSPPVVSNFSFTSNNGVITGAFDINDPEGDQVKNIIAYFGSTPRSMECSSGTLGASWDTPRGGGRVQFNASQTNVGCAALTASATTVYGFVTAQDVNGLYAAIVDAQSSNTPPAPIPVGTTTTYSIVFDAVPTTLAVKQAVDISMRIVDQNGTTATQFRGPVRISLSVSGINFSYEDPNQPAADTTSNRIVWFTNGVGRLRAFRLNDEARVRLIAVARADGTSQLTASPSAMAQAQANFLAASSGQHAKASTVGYAGVISGTSSDVSSLRSNATPNVTITLPKGTEFQSSAFLAEWKTGAIRAYLRNTFTQAELPAGGAAAAADGLSVSFAVPVDNYTLIFKRGTGPLPGGEPMQVNVGAKGFNKSASVNNFLLDSAKRRLILVHGIFGSTTAFESRAGCAYDVKIGTPDYTDIAPDMPKNLCERSADERARGVWNDSACSPSKLKFACTSNGDTASSTFAGLWDAMATRFTALGYKVVYAPWDWRLPPATAATTYLEDVVARESQASGQPVDILAHSMGGLVTMNLLQSSQFRRRVDRVVLLGTPLAGSLNAYGLMEVADPLGLDGKTKVSESFYASVAKKLYENCFMGDKGAGTFADAQGKYKQTRADRRRAFRECAPSGIYLYPDRTDLPFTKGNDTSGQLVAHIPPGSISQGVFTGANVPNDLVGVAPYAECVSDTAARSGALTIPPTGKSRITLILSDELGGLGSDDKKIETKDSVTQAGQSLNFFTGAFTAPMWSALTFTTSQGDGTVPLRGQRERLAAFLGTTFDNVDRNCSRVGKLQDHAGLTANAAALRMAELSLPLTVAMAASTSTPLDATPKAAAVIVPNLLMRVEGANAATLRNGTLPDVGVLSDGTRRDTATNLSGIVATSSVTASEIAISVDNPALGGSIAMIYRSDTNNNSALVKTVTTYGDSAAVVLSKRKTLLVRAGIPVQMNVWLDATTSLFSADVVAPAPVPMLTTRPMASSTRILWTAPATTPVAIAGYRVYAARSQDDAWTLIGSVPAGTLTYDAPYPAASTTQPEWNFLVVSVDSQDRYSEVLELGSNAVRTDIEANFGSTRGTPGATVTSAAVALPNNVPVLVSVSGGQMSVNAGAWGTTPLVINPGDTVALRGVTPATRGAQQDVVLTTGTASTTFSVLGTPLPFCMRPTRPVADAGTFVRYLKLVTGLPLLQGLYPAAEVTTTNASILEAHYRDNTTAYDFNGDNATSALVDGVLYARYALGFRGAELVSGLSVGTARTTAQIEAALAACQ